MLDLKPRSKVEMLARHLRGLIRNGTFKPGERFYSDNTLAAEFGVSHVTAAKVTAVLMSEGLVRRVQGLGTFVSESAAQESVLVGLLTRKNPDAAFGWQGYFTELADVCNARGRLPVTLGYDQILRDPSLLKRFLNQHPAGLIIDTEFCDTITPFRASLGALPVCILSERPEGSDGLPALLLDKRRCYRNMLELLWERGNRAILFYGHIPQLHRQQEEWIGGAMRDFMAAHPDTEVRYASQRDTGTPQENRLRDFATSSRPPTAVLGMTDYVATLGVRYLAEAGVRIARRNVVGFFGTAWSQQADAEFASLCVNYHGMLDRALTILGDPSVSAKPETGYTEWYSDWTIRLPAGVSA